MSDDNKMNDSAMNESGQNSAGTTELQKNTEDSSTTDPAQTSASLKADDAPAAETEPCIAGESSENAGEPAENDEEEVDDEEEDYNWTPEDDENPFFDSDAAPSVNNTAGGFDVTDAQLTKYNTEVDKEAVKAIRREWSKNKREKNKKLTPLRALILVGVAAYIPWYVYGERTELEYFFSSSEAIDLGNAEEYRLPDPGEAAKPQNFEDNRYVKISGIPNRHIPISMKENLLTGREDKVIYQLLGSNIYVLENLEGSRFASFMSRTSGTLGENLGMDELQISGRLRRFDTADAKRFAPIRQHYSQRYGTVFCENMSAADRKQKAALLGRGGVSIQIMPDDAVIQAETGTNVTLSDIRPLRGRGAVAIGGDNTILHTTDAGLSWTKSQVPIDSKITSVDYEPTNSQLVFGGQKGWVGGESYKPSPDMLRISQDVLDIAFTHPEPGESYAPRMIAVGREGLLQVAYMQREGWTPARIDDSARFNDVLVTQNRWFVVGDTLMSRKLTDTSWLRGVSPVKSKWFSLSQIPGYVVATGEKGAVARFDLNADNPVWEEWPSDDVPGIDFDADILDAATSGDGNTWVAVGKKGSILVSRKDDSGKFSRIQRISGSYAAYGVVRDIIAGNSVEASLYEALHRHTPEDLYGVTWHNGKFYAVGSDSLLMTSPDGLSWTSTKIPAVRHKLLRTIEFTGPTNGVIGGEKGTMLVTDDDGENWHARKVSTERSIYSIAKSPDYPNGYAFAGAFGLWGFCEGTNGHCYVRSKNQSHHNHGIAFTTEPQKSAYLHVLTVGNDGHIDKIDDAPNNLDLTTSLWQPSRSTVTDMAFATSELPLQPNSARGQLGLVAVGNGIIYRSLDAGYTFHHEDSGLSSPIKHITMSSNGDVAWAFDGKGNAVQDLHGLGKWSFLPAGFKDGVLVGSGSLGYLVDDHCVYRKLPDSEPQKLTCTTDNARIINVSAHKNQVTFGIIQDSQYHLYELQNDALTDKATIPAESVSETAIVLGCGEQAAVLDAPNHQFLTSTGAQSGVSDAFCDNGKFVTLTTESVREGVWKLTASSDEVVWTLETGLNPSDARFASISKDHWWIGSEAPEASDPLILKTNDNKTWSWRRDRITDMHSVAVAGAYAVAVGDNSTILVSEDYGVSWTPIQTSSNQTLRGICLSSDGTFGLAVGDGGAIYRSENGLTRWSKLTYKLNIDFTSCTVAENKDRFLYFAGKGGAIYTAPRDMSRLDLIPSPSLEDIYSITTLETGEVLAVGGVYQDPTTICEEGFIIEADRAPHSTWLALLISTFLGLLWIFAIWRLILGWTHRKDLDDDENE